MKPVYEDIEAEIAAHGYDSYQIPTVDLRLSKAGGDPNEDLDDAPAQFSAPRPGDAVPENTAKEVTVGKGEEADDRTLLVEVEDKEAAINGEEIGEYFESHGPLVEEPLTKDGRWSVVFKDASDPSGFMKWLKCAAGDGRIVIAGHKVKIQSRGEEVKAEARAITGGGG